VNISLIGDVILRFYRYKKYTNKQSYEHMNHKHE